MNEMMKNQQFFCSFVACKHDNRTSGGDSVKVRISSQKMHVLERFRSVIHSKAKDTLRVSSIHFQPDEERRIFVNALTIAFFFVGRRESGKSN